MSKSTALSGSGREPEMKGMNLLYKLDSVCVLTIKFLRGHTNLRVCAQG